MPQLSGQAIQTAIAQLDQAIYGHEQWYKNVQRVLIARLVPDAADLQPDAHHRCRFGQWCDGDGGALLADHGAFAGLGEAHMRMHAGAARILQRSADQLPISVSDLDHFTNLLDRMRLEIQSLRQELSETVANRDPLTGARNRTSQLPDLRQQQALVRRGVQECAVVMVDIDHFKAVNDEHGHTVGDTVLTAAAGCLRANVRPYDRVYRYGGEEFLISMPQLGVETAAVVAERLRVALAATELHADGTVLHVTASFGVSALDAAPVEESIDRADKALYRAKAAGRDRVAT